MIASAVSPDLHANLQGLAERIASGNPWEIFFLPSEKEKMLPRPWQLLYAEHSI